MRVRELPRPAKLVVARAELVKEAKFLRSEHGENLEYDRALAELIYFAAGGDSIEQVAQEIRAR
jgi:hypothetical protein